MSDDIKKIELKHLKTIIPKSLYRRFEQLGFSDIESVLKLDKEEFSRRRSVGRSTLIMLDEFRDKVKTQPGFIKSTYEANKEIVLLMNTSAQSNFLVCFVDLVNGYFNITHKTREKEIIFKRFGINESKKYKLEELGSYYDITREGIRQIENECLQKISTLINGGCLKKPLCKCSTEAITKIRDFKNILFKHRMLSRRDLHSLVKYQFSTEVKTEFLPYLSILLRLLEITDVTYRENIIYLIDSNINGDEFLKVCSKVFSVLEREVIPISFFDLVVNVKLKGRVENSLIKLACDVMIEVEEVRIGSEVKYQLEFDKLSSARDFALRILYERQESLHYKEICREINHRLSSAKAGKRITTRGLVTQMINDEKFVPKGRTGFWSLKEWEENTQTLVNLVLDAFHFLNRACSAKDIFEHIVSDRPTVKKNSINTILTMYSNLFSRIKGNKYILKEWEEDYKKRLVSGTRGVISKGIFQKTLIQIFTQRNCDKLSRRDIKDELKKQNFHMSDSGFDARLNKTKILRKELYRGRIYFSLVENHKDLINETTKPKKSVIMKDNIVELLENTDNKRMLLSEVVKILHIKYNYPQGSLYKIVQTEKDFVKHTNKAGKIEILLRKYVVEPTKDLDSTNKKRAILELIKSGESNLVEFKSSLRWDYKNNCTNKNLEFAVAKAIASFLNSEGGNLFIGVDDHGKILGLRKDYGTLPKRNQDGFQLQLTNVINNYLGKAVHKYISITFESLENEEICCVQVSKSNSEVFLKKDHKNLFYIRASGSSELLDTKDAVEYIKSHWQ